MVSSQNPESTGSIPKSDTWMTARIQNLSLVWSFLHRATAGQLLNDMGKGLYYGVKVGRKRGVYQTW